MSTSLERCARSRRAFNASVVLVAIDSARLAMLIGSAMAPFYFSTIDSTLFGGRGGPSYREAKDGDVQPAPLVLLEVGFSRSPTARNFSLTPSPPRHDSGDLY